MPYRNTVCLFIITLFIISDAYPVTYTSTNAFGGTTWTDPCTWGDCAGSVPSLSTDDVIISAGTSVSTSAASTCGSLTIDATGTLAIGAATYVAVNGNVIVNGTSTGGIIGLVTSGSTVDGNGSVNNLYFLIAAGTRTILSTANLTITNSVRMVSACTVTLNGILTVSSTSSFLASSDAGSVFEMGTNGYLKLRSNNISGTPSFTADATGCTVEYYRNGSQTVRVPDGTATYYNLVINNASITPGVILLGGSITISNQLTLTDGILDLNTYKLTIANPASGAIIGGSLACYINSGLADHSNQIEWDVRTTIGTYTFPIGYYYGATGVSYYIPVIFDKTTAGTETGTGKITISTYPTAADNTPLPSSPTVVTHAGDPADVADRFWEITLSGYTAGTVTADITLSYIHEEAPANGNIDLVAQRWNASASDWDAPISGQTFNASTAGNSGNVTVPNVTDFSPWTIARSAAPLPIELLSFNAIKNNNNVLLSWVTATEINNDFFSVERSSNGIDIEVIGRMKGEINSTKQKLYELVDDHPLFGSSYYRLKQTDIDGSYSYSQWVSIQNFFVSDNIKVYPNPSNGDFYIDYPLNISGQKNTSEIFLSIYNSAGQNVYRSDIKFTNENCLINISLSDILEAGEYVVCLKNNKEYYCKILSVE